MKNCADEILFRNQPSNKWLPSTEYLINKKLFVNVFKCINGDSCDDFNDYFERVPELFREHLSWALDVLTLYF